MSAETVKNRRVKIPKYVLAYFHEDEQVNIVPKEKIVNVDVLKEFSNDRSKKLVVKAKFLVKNDRKGEEQIYEGDIIDVNGM